jgi:hypothetical protein
VALSRRVTFTGGSTHENCSLVKNSEIIFFICGYLSLMDYQSAYQQQHHRSSEATAYLPIFSLSLDMFDPVG